MELIPATLIGSQAIPGAGPAIRAHDPIANLPLDPEFHDSSPSQIGTACQLAEAAFDPYRAAPLEARAALLEAIAEEILALGDILIERAMAETGLPRPRLEGERTRTVGQLRFFAAIVRQGRFLALTVDSAQPDRKPFPRPDLRLRKIPLGPVAVFGASNFPLAFSVAGGDTASALAAGCPVVVKAHPSHPGTSQLVGQAIQRAVASSGLPEGIFSLLHGRQNAVGEALVQDPAIAAVGFTGSRRGGLALVKLASQRLIPIPVFAEMSSVNPVFLLPYALGARTESIAQGFVDSMTLGAGQFCTQPGLLLAIDNPGTHNFLKIAGERLQQKPAMPMLNSGICKAYSTGLEKLLKANTLQLIAQGSPNADGLRGQAALFSTDAATFLARPELSEELFGPSSLAILCTSSEELLRVASSLEGQLTTTLQMDQGDTALAQQLLPTLERKAGRILVNGFPTGVEVGAAMVHGGPYPSTSDSRSTSVGALAIDRFLRPICYQDFPAQLLPPELKEDNPLDGINVL